MKSCMAGVVMLLLLAGCQGDPGALKPPRPTITAGGQELFYKIGTYSWSGHGRTVIADAVSPEEYVKKVNVVSRNAVVTIAFDREPEALKAGVLKNHEVQFTPISGNSVKLPDEPHPFIYVIHAKWKKGEADYAMKITWQEEKE